MKRTKSLVSAAIAASLLAACGGGASMLPSSLRPADTTQVRDQSKGKARVEIRIPRHRKRRGHFVSPNTASMSIAANGKSLGKYALTPSSKGCTTDGGSTQCSFTVGVPTGKVNFAVVLYDKANAVLSQGNVTSNVTAGTLAVIPLVLSGVVNSIKVSLGDAHPNAGTATSVAVYVTAYDASGAAIVGPGSYNKAVALSNSDSSGITSLSKTTADGPSAKIALAYNGKSMLSATIGASSAGVAPSSVKSATFEPTPAVVASYSLPAALGLGTSPYAITGGPDGNVWITTQRCDFCGPGSGSNAIVVMSTAGTVIHQYVAGTTPNLTANGTFQGIATGPDGNVWFTDYTNHAVGKIDGSGNVTEYSTAAMCPNRIVAGSDGALWFTSYCTSDVGRVTVGGTVTSNAIAGASTQFNGIIAGKGGNLYAVDRGNNEIWQLKIAAGAVSSASSVSIPDTENGQSNADLTGIAQTNDGQLWFTNQNCPPETIGSIVINPTSFASSTVHEFNANQGCSEPSYMTAVPGASELFIAMWDYPVIDRLIPTTPGNKPDLKDFAFQTVTPNGVAQQTFDVTIGPDGDVWATTHSSSSGYYAGQTINVVKMAY